MPDGAYKAELKRLREQGNADFDRVHQVDGAPAEGPTARERLERLGIQTSSLGLPKETDLDHVCVVHLALAEHYARGGHHAEARHEADLGLRALRHAGRWAVPVEDRLWRIYKA
jgi:hypothetical protein